MRKILSRVEGSNRRSGIFAKVALLLVSWFFAQVGFAQAVSEEVVARQQMQTRLAFMWAQEDYGQMDRMAAELRAKRPLTPGGLPQLHVFYEWLAVQVGNQGDTARRDEAKRRTFAWIERFPDSPAGHLQYAGILIREGWNARGTGYVDTVTPEGEAVLKQKFDEAKAYLEAHRTVAAKDPRWYELMVGVAKVRGGSAAQVQRLVADSLRLDPTYYDTAFDAVDYFSPRWGGSLEAMDRFIVSAADQAPPSSRDELYARLYWAAAGDAGRGRVNATRVDCKRMMRGVDDMARLFPERRNINYFARFAVDCGDRDRARIFFKFIGGEPYLPAWWNSSSEFVRFSSWNDAANGLREK